MEPKASVVGVRVSDGDTPVPGSATWACAGVAPEPTLTFMMETTDPGAVGLKALETVREVPAAMLVGQLVVRAVHCSGFVPPLVGALTGRVAAFVLVLVTVTD